MYSRRQRGTSDAGDVENNGPGALSHLHSVMHSKERAGKQCRIERPDSPKGQNNWSARASHARLRAGAFARRSRL